MSDLEFISIVSSIDSIMFLVNIVRDVSFSDRVVAFLFLRSFRSEAGALRSKGIASEVGARRRHHLPTGQQHLDPGIVQVVVRRRNSVV